jgi:hypothetical protein
MASGSRMASAHGSVSTLGSAGGSMASMNSSVAGSRGGVSSIVQGAIVYGGSSSSAAIIRKFQNMRENKREKNGSKYEKRHQELRAMSTKPK